MSDEKKEGIAVELSRSMIGLVIAIVAGGVLSFCGALFLMYKDVELLKADQQKWTQQRQVSVKQWEKLRRLKDKQAKDTIEINKFIYTFHGKDILGIKHNHK